MFSQSHWGQVPPHCRPENEFLHLVSSTFNTCVPTWLALLSTTCGVLSIVSWLFAQVPQIIKNFQLRSTSGLSIYFLAEWLLGDMSNLVGSMLTQQASWQIVLATYYCFVDCVLVGQWMWYEHLRHGRVVRRLRWWKRSPTEDDGESPTHKKKIPKIHDQKSGKSKPIATKPYKSLLDETSGSGGNSPRPSSSPFTMPHFSFSSAAHTTPNPNTAAGSPSTPSTAPRQILRPAQISTSPTPSPRTILYITLLLAIATTHASPTPLTHSLNSPPAPAANHSDYIHTLGTLISWLSTALYLASRLPQLLLNHSRRSTAGLSPTLFAAAFSGNFFYSSSLLSNPQLWADYPPNGARGWVGSSGSLRGPWALAAMPFFLGAAGVLVMDAAMGVQFVLYGSSSDAEEGGEISEVLVVENDGVKGPGRWRKVSGWMRGWMPVAGVGKAKRVVDGGYETDTQTGSETESLLSERGDDAGSVRSYGATTPTR